MKFFQIHTRNDDPYSAGYEGNVFGSKAEAKRAIELLDDGDWHVAKLSRPEAEKRNAYLVRQYDEAETG